MTVIDMIKLFYHVKPYQLSGGPDWIDKKRFDVTAKDSTLNPSSPEYKAEHWSEALDAEDVQMQELLKDRFGLKLHHEIKTLPTLLLLVDLRRRFAPVPCSSGYRLQHGFVKGAIPLASLIALLKVEFNKPVRDGTGLDGCYYIDTHWAMGPDDESFPYVTTALHELGFHLKNTTSDVDVLIVDHAALPLPD